MTKPKTKAKRKKAPRGKASKMHPSNVEAQVRAAQAIEKRMEGKTFQEIADELGYASKQAAHKAVTTALNDTISEKAEQYRTLELRRLDKMFELPVINAQAGDNFAIASCLRIMERRARLIPGLEVPQETKGKLDVDHDFKGGVLVAPAVMTEDGWLQAAAQSQAKLYEAEKSVRVDGDENPAA
jgi:hypothetical protein